MNAQQCPSCGNELKAGLPTCGRCGAVIPAAGASSSSVAPARPIGTAEPIPATESLDAQATTSRSVLAASTGSPAEQTMRITAAPPFDATALRPRPALPYVDEVLTAQPTPAPALPVGDAQQTVIGSKSWSPPVGPPMSGPPPGALQDRPPIAFLPPEVGVVALLLVVLGGFLLYPLCRYGFPLASDLGSSTDFLRAFAALFLYLVVLFGAVGLALILLAIGLVRARRVSQILTCLVCAIVILAEAINSPSGFSTAASTTTQRAVGIIGSLIVIGLLLLPNAQRFFAREQRATLGVDVAAAIGLYFGVCAAISGLLLVVLGTVELTYAWFGAGLAVSGLALAVATRPLRNGSPTARVLVCVAYAAYVIVGFVVGANEHEVASPQTIVPLLIALAALAALLAPASSQEHFRRPRPTAGSNAPAIVAASLAVVLIAAIVAVGLRAAHDRTHVVAQSGPSIPTFAPEPSQIADNAETTSAQASETMSGLLNEMETSGYASTCTGSTDGLAIADYTVGAVTPQTDGTFLVSSDVTLRDGTTQIVTALIGTRNDQPCVEDNSVSVSDQTSNSQPVQAAAPADVPSVPSSGDSVPTDAALPAAPSDSAYPYDDAAIPARPAQIVEYRPSGLDTDQNAAVSDVIAFMAYINQQRFAPAWSASTKSLEGPAPDSGFRRGYRTSAFYQVAFGQPRQVSSDLMVIPARFASHQDPAAQGYPNGVTGCSYWPQYLFVVARVDGSWLVDVAGRYSNSNVLDRFKRPGSDGDYLNPLQQREAC